LVQLKKIDSALILCENILENLVPFNYPLNYIWKKLKIHISNLKSRNSIEEAKKLYLEGNSQSSIKAISLLIDIINNEKPFSLEVYLLRAKIYLDLNNTISALNDLTFIEKTNIIEKNKFPNKKNKNWEILLEKKFFEIDSFYTFGKKKKKIKKKLNN
jgi:hypothetical protein